MSHTIVLRKVSKYYAGEDTVSMGFSRIDLDLDIGEFVAITGESGSGKSTLLNVISGLDTYEEGEMFVCGEDTTAYGTEDYERYRKTYIGNIFQDFNLINSYTVYQNIEIVMLLSGKKKKECGSIISELLDKVGLSEYAKTKVARLSGGQKQRVAIARALAKDAPIIVADEPTGNLDSASAASVMETLYKVSKDKLVVIVTHNYDQAEPYVTRKLTMHDGRIIEDKKFARRDDAEQIPAGPAPELPSQVDPGSKYDEEVITDTGRMRKSSELRLGVRNTFNIPAKFMLLFIVYFFVSTAVLGQYATTKNSLHQNDLLGYNEYFTNTSSDRVIVKKADETAFTEGDIVAVSETDNVRSVVLNDLAVDRGVSITVGEIYVDGSVYPVSDVDEADLTYGHMPKSDYEILIKCNSSSDSYYTLSEMGEEFIGQTVKLSDMGQMQEYRFDKNIKIAGIIIDEEEGDGSYMMYGYSTIYVSDKVSKEMMISMMANSSKTTLIFDDTRLQGEEGYDRMIYSSDRVPKGKAYIFEDELYYYKDEKAIGKKVGIEVSNRFFESKINLEVSHVLTYDNFFKSLGISNSEYDMYYNAVYISTSDLKKLFDKGYFQISVFLENENDADATLKELQSMGYTTLALKDSLTDMTGGFDFVIQLITYGRLLIEFIILFYIAYAVIRLIMRSRNSYYSTLRILGATKKNTDTILKVELIIMMLIAYAVDILFVILVRTELIDISSLRNLLYFLSLSDYVILGIVLLAMSLLIANRYSRKIFTKSAMKTFRGEVQ